MDECTASVDVETDALLQAMVREVFRDYTIFTIAHVRDQQSGRAPWLARARATTHRPTARLLIACIGLVFTINVLWLQRAGYIVVGKFDVCLFCLRFCLKFM